MYFYLIDESFCKLVLDKPSQTENSKNTMSDISDGSEYRRMTNLPKISPKERNLTFTMNTGNKKRVINFLQNH